MEKFIEIMMQANDEYAEKTREVPFELRVGAACMLIELATKDAGKPIGEVIEMVSSAMGYVNETLGEI